MSTMARHRPQSNEGLGHCFARSPHVRATALREDAARLNRRALNRCAKKYAPLLSPQKVSDARVHGGALGDLSVQMLADPSNAMLLATHAMSVARMLTMEVFGSLTSVMCAEQRADGREDDAQVDVLTHETPETLRAYIEAADEALAKLQAARDAAARRLEELERGES